MPVYEYRCTQCQKVFEYQQRMADAAKTTCEECSGALERLISRSSFALKGDGWYKDLYSSSKPAADASKPAEASTPATETKPAESKPAESKPAESKPAESKPASTDKPSSSGSGSGGGAAAGPA